MKIRTRDFGVIEIEDTSEITFVSPILGFENQSRFVFLNDDSRSEERRVGKECRL